MIYVVRHGQTDWNVAGRFQGSTDIPLNSKGIQQAKTAANELKDIRFDIVFCSPLERAKKTCEIIHSGQITFDNRIVERNYGDYEGQGKNKLPLAELWNNKKVKNIYSVEPITDFEKRVFAFYDEITKKHPEKNILVVCHGGVVRLTKGYFRGAPKDGDYLKTYGYEDNASVLAFENMRRKKK